MKSIPSGDGSISFLSLASDSAEIVEVLQRRVAILLSPSTTSSSTVAEDG